MCAVNKAFSEIFSEAFPNFQSPITVKQLTSTAYLYLDRLDVNILCAAALNWPRTKLITNEQTVLNRAQIHACQLFLAARAKGVPVAYILNTREFFGLEFYVSPKVLIPRPETELLVEQALKWIETNSNLSNENGRSRQRILDMGTGSGAVAIAIAKYACNIDMVAVDQSEAALAIAYKNAVHLLPECLVFSHQHKLHDEMTVNSQQLSNKAEHFFQSNKLTNTIRFIKSDWYTQLKSEIKKLRPFQFSRSSQFFQAQPNLNDKFDLIVSNPPYIAANDQHLAQGDCRFEPKTALTDENNGLSAIHNIIAGAYCWLNDMGELWIEHGYDQSIQVNKLLTKYGFTQIKTLFDLANHPRVTGGILKK